MGGYDNPTRIKVFPINTRWPLSDPRPSILPSLHLCLIVGHHRKSFLSVLQVLCRGGPMFLNLGMHYRYKKMFLILILWKNTKIKSPMVYVCTAYSLFNMDSLLSVCSANLLCILVKVHESSSFNWPNSLTKMQG